jgi:hypothetical protein
MRSTQLLVVVMVAYGAAQDAANTPDILALLERDLQGKMTPWLAGRRGSFYMGGQSLAQNNPLTSLWDVRENETIGFMHPYFRDSRARGIAIVCDEITGCGHSLHDWEFYRDTRVLNGTVTVNNRTYMNPYPTTLLWRPDRLTARYEIEAGVVLEEVKFFTNDDVLVDIITLLPSDDASAPSTVMMSFDGVSYVNTNKIPPASRDPSSKGLPDDTQRSIKRNATVEVDARFAISGCGGFSSGALASSCSAIRVEEHGTAYAKPIDCDFAPFPPGIDCLIKEGKLMYEGQSVFIAASTDISATAVLGRDADRRAIYSFTAPLSAEKPLVLGWVMGDDEDAARKRIAAYMTPAAAAAALSARSTAANTFLTTKVPQLNVTLKPKQDDQDHQSHASVYSTDDKGNGTFDEHKSATCHNTNANKYNFLHNTPTLAACEAACAADVKCAQVEYKHKAPGLWCAMYNKSTAPSKMLPDSDFDCACKGPCPGPAPGPGPGPGPKPPKPSPIPPMNRTLDFNNAYYFGWAMYWLMLLEADHPPYETIGHAQSAANNFLGIHLHDSQYYLRMGGWVTPELHPRYAHGNVLMWERAAFSPMYSNKTSPYWQARSAKGLLPDNMGANWIASSTCDQGFQLVEGAMMIYEHAGVLAPNATFLAKAYDFFNTVFRASDGNITSAKQKQNFASGKGLSGLLSMAKMAKALGKPEEAAEWQQLADTLGNGRFRKNWGQCGNRISCDEGINSFGSAMAPSPYFDDDWAAKQADDFLLNDVTGYYPPNASFGAVLLAKPLNTTATKIGPWVAHTTYTYEAIEGLFRHNVQDAAIKLATEHVRDMQRTYGWTIFPEAWSLLGGPWGDQWYNWGSCVSTVMTLERLAGVSYSSTDRATGATTPGILTVRDFLPADWERANVRVPLGGDRWVVIDIESVGPKSKRITVSGNPLGALALQPSLGSHGTLTKAEPAGSTTEKSGDRVDWLFVGAAAKAATVTVEWA